MERDHLDAILDLVHSRLSGLDFITRREVLKALLRNSAFLGLVGGGGASLLLPTEAGAQRRTFISEGALRAAPPDGRFERGRTFLVDGMEGVTQALIDDILAGADVFATGRIVEDPGTARATETCGMNACIPEHTCEVNSCAGQGCGDHACGTDSCNQQGCERDGCADSNECGTDGCGTSNTCGGEKNTCGTLGVCGPEQHTCSGTDTCGENGWLRPQDFLGRYLDEPFVRELRELFGQNVELEIESMIRNRTTLRRRGLLDPQAPPPAPPLGEVFRNLPGARLPQPPGTVSPPVVPRGADIRTKIQSAQPPPPPPATAPRVTPPATAPRGTSPATAPRGTTPAAPVPPATTTLPPTVGPKPGTGPAPPAVDPRRLQPPAGTPGSSVPPPQPKAPLQ